MANYNTYKALLVAVVHVPLMLQGAQPPNRASLAPGGRLGPVLPRLLTASFVHLHIWYPRDKRKTEVVEIAKSPTKQKTGSSVIHSSPQELFWSSRMHAKHYKDSCLPSLHISIFQCLGFGSCKTVPRLGLTMLPELSWWSWRIRCAS